MTSPMPDVITEVSWSTNPDDTPVWVDLGEVAESITTSRGRGYEQDQAQTGQLTEALDNSTGDFTGDNTASAYYPNVETDKQIRVRVTPPAPYNGTTYGLFWGSINDLPTDVSPGAFETASTPLTALDAFEALGVTTLRSAFDHEVLKSAPVAFYPCSDLAGAGQVGNQAPTSASSALLTYKGVVGGQYKLGATPMLTADAGTSLELSPATGTLLGLPITTGGYHLDFAKATAPPYLPSTGGWAVEVEIAASAAYLPNLMTVFYQASGTNRHAQATISDGFIVFQAGYLPGGTSYDLAVVAPTAVLTDGQPHLLGFSLSADRKTATIHLDGLPIATASIGSAAVFTDPPVALLVGSQAGPNGASGSWVVGRVSKVAFYDRPLTDVEVAAHYAAAAGFPGERAGARVARILDYAGFPAARRNLDTGLSVCGPLLCTDIDALPLLQKVAQTEQGVIFVAGDGRFTFRDRHRILNSISRVTLGTLALPVETDGLRFTKDKQRIKNDIKASRPNGPTLRLRNQASIDAHRKRTFTTTYEVNNDHDLSDVASWELLIYANPRMRVSTIVLDPLTAPALWPWVFGLEIGDRITITNLPSYAPATTLDFIVQSIGHAGKQGPEASWRVPLQLSPPLPFTTLRADAAASAYTRLDAGLKIPY